MNKNLRILFITAGYPFEKNLLPSIFIRTMVVSLAQLGVKIDVVAPVPWAPWPFSNLSSKWKMYKNTPKKYIDQNDVVIYRPNYIQIPYIYKTQNIHDQFVLAIKSCIKIKPDLIHAHNSYAPGLAAAILSKKWGLPSVLTLHGSDVNVYPNYGKIERERFIKAIKGQLRVTAVSTDLAKKTEQISGVRPDVIHIGKDLTMYKSLPEKHKIRSLLNIPQDKFIVLFVGRLIKEKGIMELISSLNHLKDDGIVGFFCGEGNLESEIRRNDNAVLCGLVEPEKVFLYMAASDVLILPSYSEGMPTVLIEGGATGIPIIATRVGGIPELLGEDRGLLISPKSINEIILGIREIKENPEKTDAKTKSMKNYIFSNYDVNMCSNKLIEIYYELIATYRKKN
ncbi:MAG: glycosyltransferase [Anaerolineaceae bacterium]